MLHCDKIKDRHVRNGVRDDARGFSVIALGSFSKKVQGEQGELSRWSYEDHALPEGLDHGLVYSHHEEAGELQTALSVVRDFACSVRLC